METAKIAYIGDKIKKLAEDFAILDKEKDNPMLNFTVCFNNSFVINCDNPELTLKSYKQLRYEIKFMLEQLRTELVALTIIEEGD